MHQTYQLIIEIVAPVTVSVGKLGIFEFPAGIYVYTGSAKRNFEARIARHLSSEKRLRWHVDYLLAASGVFVRDVKRFCAPECWVNQQVEGEVLIRGFGASDCHHACGSHLKWCRSSR